MEKEPLIERESEKVWLTGRLQKITNEILCDDELFMAIAKLSAMKQGHHEKFPQFTQGACIVDDNKRVLSVGQSGYPEIMNKRAIGDIQYKKLYYDGDAFMAHAEYKAILAKGTPSFRGCTLYVTKFPCHGCAQVIVQSGIKKVFYNKAPKCFKKEPVEVSVTKEVVATKRELVTTKEKVSIKKGTVIDESEDTLMISTKEVLQDIDDKVPVTETVSVVTPILESTLNPSDAKLWRKQAKTNSYFASKEHTLKGMDIEPYNIEVTRKQIPLKTYQTVFTRQTNVKGPQT
ncbi:PREDICTED: comE operon protein 2-like isoform X1 [Amphimedon queenslandica]|uniref:dCMP deaminase n=1 Tax=Amphimedon queenslandica TaxID=400682 RepID=A0AAN0J0N0_AMPQE|nr:PREDICTED: comE operon protein 2-like isoform X1 [Amphimedon queenslandica]|eukprot:XP_019850281.1 PREDICTED: comE operon protein 2-like isoform X1 [Amphimedon queenslandica]